jgi:4-alpha-glucanotransferase
MSDAAPSLPRTAGVLLHPSSLPGPFGIGDLGPAAFRWVDQLAAMKQRWWQILPLGPTGAGDSPYQSFSAFAGNVNLLSPELLLQDGLVSDSLWAGQRFDDSKADLGRVAPFKRAVLRAAWDSFRGGRAGHLRGAFDHYVHQEAWWLDDYALFMAVRDALGGAGLATWPDEVIRRDPPALAALAKDLATEVSVHQFGQFLFDRQWTALKRHANERGVRLIGDIPIFVSPDSADVWANRHQFLVDDHGRPTVVAGVPPDYFAADGQLWGTRSTTGR